tara:strand:- start:2075 stop:2320 length:246 start_codon:yes stop_codon:yes gene_type:complete
VSEDRNFTLDDLMGVNEVAEFLNVRPNLISTWLHRDKMPMADVVLNAGKTQVWLRHTIESWANATGKAPFDYVSVDWRKQS